LRYPGPLTTNKVAELVATAHRRSAVFVKRRQLAGISAVNPADLDDDGGEGTSTSPVVGSKRIESGRT
jgi:hypothetical protein